MLQENVVYIRPFTHNLDSSLGKWGPYWARGTKLLSVITHKVVPSVISRYEDMAPHCHSFAIKDFGSIRGLKNFEKL